MREIRRRVQFNVQFNEDDDDVEHEQSHDYHLRSMRLDYAHHAVLPGMLAMPLHNALKLLLCTQPARRTALSLLQLVRLDVPAYRIDLVLEGLSCSHVLHRHVGRESDGDLAESNLHRHERARARRHFAESNLCRITDCWCCFIKDWGEETTLARGHWR
jgi:hypothetical protein